MRYMIPALLLASPAVAHPASVPHTHAADWAVPLAVALILVAGVVARRQAVRAKA